MSSDMEVIEHKDIILRHTTDGEEGLIEYLKTNHVNRITNNSIVLYCIKPDHIFIYYMQAFNKKGFKECRKLALELFGFYTIRIGSPILYTGESNLYKNNSINVGNNVWQFAPKNFHA